MLQMVRPSGRHKKNDQASVVDIILKVDQGQPVAVALL